MTDSGLVFSMLRLNTERIRRDADRSGKLLESFAFNELASLVDAGDGQYEIYHYRNREKREIDFIVTRDDGALLGIEVKAAATAQRDDFRHLEWFRDRIAGRKRPFVGIVPYSGKTAGGPSAKASGLFPSERCGPENRSQVSPRTRFDGLRPKAEPRRAPVRDGPPRSVPRGLFFSPQFHTPLFLPFPLDTHFKKCLTFNLADIMLLLAHLPRVEGVTRSFRLVCGRPQLFLAFPLIL